MKTIECKPFLKWAGGKQAIADSIIQAFPCKFGRYFEPFVGGGSILLARAPDDAVIGDCNGWLIDTYLAVRDDWGRVARILDRLPNTRDDYLRIRKETHSNQGVWTRAAYFIYLNKTCFRGLFRVNQKNQFNVPYGDYQRRYYDPDNLAAVSELLSSVEIRKGDYELTLHDVVRGDFVYFDPPYYKLGGYSDFNRYTADQFRESDHIRLAAVCRELDARGVKWLVSNSNTGFVRALFDGFSITEIEARREINLTSKNRSVVELLVSNY